MLTIEDIKKMDKAYLIPKEVAQVLGVDQYSINVQVREDKKNGVNSLGFPTILIGSRVKIPREAFLRFMCGEEAAS